MLRLVLMAGVVGVTTAGGAYLGTMLNETGSADPSAQEVYGPALVKPAHAITVPDPADTAETAQVSPALPTVEEVATATVSPKTTTVSVGRGDTLMRLLTKNDVPRTDAHAVVTALEPVFDLRRLQIGQEFALTFTPEEDGQGGLGRLEGVQFAAAPGKDIEVSLKSGDGWVARSIEHALVRKDSRVAGSIETSLYDAALAAEMPIDILLRMIRLFSYDVDFQRDIQSGDSFDVLFERDLNDEGDVVKLGEMVYAAMTLSGKEYAYYRHTPSSGFTDFFDKNGKSVRKALMRTPINGARLTSRFGKRKHPILGYTKMHRGVDFGAPTGTPIMAAGDGVVDYVGRNGAYGKYIRLRHHDSYKTAYAHLSRYAKGLSKGTRVRQGETIGYVGSTGRSTGPHLHYEVIREGRRLNPMSVKIPAGETLKGKDLKQFANARATADTRLAKTEGSLSVAIKAD